VCRNWVQVDVPSWQNGEDAPAWPPSGSFPSARA
jgi:hypothetical protein